MSTKACNVNDLGFAPGGARLTPVAEAEGLRCLLICLYAGEAVEPCKMLRTVLYVVLEGRGSLQVSDEAMPLVSGSVAIVPKGLVRCIRAEEQMRILAVQA
ncbi:MAG: cupin domain-containing protein [Chloroflexi bacterium]|mgnify:CR=1 FL=1|nr:cupin domain-containing protein [Chloroflexota bacterium]